MNSETSEKTLSVFMEGRVDGDTKVTYVVFSEDRSMAVVEFSSPIGMLSSKKTRMLIGICLVLCRVQFRFNMHGAVLFVDVSNIQDNCNKKTLQGKYLEVTPINPVKYIIVSGEEDITVEDLSNYFQDRSKSNAGNVLRVSSWDNGCYSVKFRNEKGMFLSKNRY